MSDDDVISYKLSSDFEVSGSKNSSGSAREKEKKKKKKEANKVLLSFGGDENEEDPEFVVKKTKPKQSLAEIESAQKKAKSLRNRVSKANPDISGGREKGKDRSERGREKPKEHTNLRSSAGEYTKDKLNALKDNAIHLSSSSGSGNSSKKKESEKVDMEFLGESVRSILEGEDDEDDGFDIKMRRVEEVKRRRAIARTVGEENFIPLSASSSCTSLVQNSNTNSSNSSNSKKTEKRLEEDEDEMAGEYLESYTNNQRIMFGDPGSDRHKKQREEEKRREFTDRRPKKKTVSVVETSSSSASFINSSGSCSSSSCSSSSTKVTTLISQKNKVSLLLDSDSGKDEDDDSEDENFRKWENEQIKKGAGATYVVEKKEKITTTTTTTQKQPSKPSAPTPRAKVSVEGIRAKMCTHINELKEQSAKRGRDLDNANQQLEAARNALEGLKVDMTRSNQQYQFFQEVRDHIADALDCATAKIPLIEKCQERMVGIQKAYSKNIEMHIKLNANDLEREAFNEQRTEEKTKAGKTVKEIERDEFGREINEEEHMRPRRESARLARKLKRNSQEPEGWSTDEGEGADSYEMQRTAVREEAKKTFEDVTEDYQSIDHVKGIMENWKKQYPASYSDAYISLSLPALFAPYLRIETLCWQPLSRPHFDTLASYQKLFSFGEEENDPDFDLLPKLLSMVAVPHVCSVLLYQYNPLSRKQTLKAVELMKDCVSHLEDNAASVDEIKKALFTRLAKSVHVHSMSKVVPSWKPSDPETDSLVKQMEFCHMRCWKAIKLFGNVLKFHDIMGKDLLELAASHASDSILPFLVWLLEKEESNSAKTGGMKLAESLNLQLAATNLVKDSKAPLMLLKQNIMKLLEAKAQSSAHFIAVGSLKEMCKRS